MAELQGRKSSSFSRYFVISSGIVMLRSPDLQKAFKEITTHRGVRNFRLSDSSVLQNVHPFILAKKSNDYDFIILNLHKFRC